MESSSQAEVHARPGLVVELVVDGSTFAHRAQTLSRHTVRCVSPRHLYRTACFAHLPWRAVPGVQVAERVGVGRVGFVLTTLAGSPFSSKQSPRPPTCSQREP